MITVVDYGLGNLRSVSKALETTGARVEVTSNPEKIAKARVLVLPGVGAFSRGMENLERLCILPEILKLARDGKPILGICLGLQLLFTKSEEHGSHRGLDIIKGRVKKFNPGMKIPHIGWNMVEKLSNGAKVFDGIPDESYFYFVHSYYVEPEDEKIIVATTEYGRNFASAINKDNIWGTQFHPEKSGEPGLKFLDRFCRGAEGGK